MIWKPNLGLLPELSDEERAVIDALWPDHVGAAHALARAELAKATEIPDRDLRDTLAALTINRRVPIIGAMRPPYGYYIAGTLDELRAAEEVFDSYIESLAVRRAAIRRIRAGIAVEQVELFPERFPN